MPEKISDVKCFKTRVFYYDTDQMGVVYHANYLKWMDMARTEYFRDTMPYREIEEKGFMLPVKTLEIEYIDSARYDDEIEIFIELKKISGIKVEFHYKILDGNGKLKAAANTVNVFTDKNGKLKRIPGEMLKILKKSTL